MSAINPFDDIFKPKAPPEIVPLCWFCGRAINDRPPHHYDLRGYGCFLHGDCALRAKEEAGPWM